MRKRSFLAVVAVALSMACASSPASPSVPAGAVRVNGIVQFYAFEGGFWTVKGDDGVTYDPKDGLPVKFQVPDRRVTMVARVLSDIGNTHMAGPIVEIISIE